MKGVRSKLDTSANLAQARANLINAQSDLERTKVQLVDAQQKYTRAKAMGFEGTGIRGEF